MAPREGQAKKLMAIGLGADNYVSVQYADDSNVAIIRSRRSTLTSGTLGTGKTSSSTQSGSYLYESFWDVGWDNIPVLDTLYPHYERRIIPFFERVNRSLNAFGDFVPCSCFSRRRNNENKVIFKDEDSPLPPVRSIVIDATHCDNFTIGKIRNRLHVLTDNVILKLFYKTTSSTVMSQIQALCGLDVPRLALHMEFEDVYRDYPHPFSFRLLLLNDIIDLYDRIASGIKEANSEYRFFVAIFKWNYKNTLPAKQSIVDKLRRRKVQCLMTSEVKNSIMDFRFRMMIEGRGNVFFEVVLRSLDHSVHAIQ